MDAAELIDELKRLHAQGKDITALLSAPLRAQPQHSAALMLAGMQGFREMFSGTIRRRNFFAMWGLNWPIRCRA